MQNQDITFWAKNWVGRSKVSAFFNNSKTGALETINIGKRTSSVFLRIYDKLAQAIKEGDVIYWLDIWGVTPKAVTRVEWQVRPVEGGFTIQDFQILNGAHVQELLNYLITWGRLCEPDTDNLNRSRWKDAEFWKILREIVDGWLKEIYWPASRLGKEFKAISDAYIRSLCGVMTSGMARLSVDLPSLYGMLDGLEKYGVRMEDINQKAIYKAKVFSKL